MTTADDRLTKIQEVFLARAAILELVGQFQTVDGDEIGSIDVSFDGGATGVTDEDLFALGVDKDVLDGFRLATADLERARVIVEEAAAFNHLMSLAAEQMPDVPKSELRKSVREVLADPEKRTRAAVDSGVYARMGLEPVMS